MCNTEKTNQQAEENNPMLLLKNWIDINNNGTHPCDNERFYEIVWQTIDHKIGQDEFNQVVNPNNDVDKESFYSKYEDLYFFAMYLLEKGRINI